MSLQAVFLVSLHCRQKDMADVDKGRNWKADHTCAIRNALQEERS